jgi:Holliday junction resolvasome RuvABC endonuclease subunit
VGAILSMRELPNVDAADALAVAITHANALLTTGLRTPPARARSAPKPRR